MAYHECMEMGQSAISRHMALPKVGRYSRERETRMPEQVYHYIYVNESSKNLRKYLKITYPYQHIGVIMYTGIPHAARAIFVYAVTMFLSCLLSSCSLSDRKPEEQYGIVNTSGAQMRIDPMVFAGIVGELNQGDAVIIIERSKEKTWVGKIQDYWYHVKTKDGLTGWVFGQNLKIKKSASAGSIESMVSEFKKVEEARIRSNIAGKWWSINEFGDFTDHCLELYDNGKYRSYMKEAEGRQIIGTYRIDLSKNAIVFSKGTSFKTNCDIARRGNDYILKKRMPDYDLRFTKISIETSPEPDIAQSDSETTPHAGGKDASQ